MALQADDAAPESPVGYGIPPMTRKINSLRNSLTEGFRRAKNVSLFSRIALRSPRRFRWRLAFAAFLLGFAAAPEFAWGQFGGCPGCSPGMGGSSGMGGGAGTGFTVDDFAMGMRAIHFQHYADAIPHLEKALVTRPHSADIMNDLGLAHRMLGNYSASLTWIQKALSENPDHKEAHENLGELELAMNDQAAAQAQLTELARLCPESCDERDVLTRAMAAYQAAHPAMPAPSAAVPAAQAGSH